MTVYVKMITGVEENHMLAAAFGIDRVKERLESGNVMWRQKRKSGSFSPGHQGRMDSGVSSQWAADGEERTTTRSKPGECAWSRGPGNPGHNDGFATTSAISSGK